MQWHYNLYSVSSNSGHALCGLGHRIVRAVFVHAALAAWSCTHITAARASFAAGKVVAISVLAASATRSDADVSTARRVRAALEFCSMAVCAHMAIRHLIWAESGLSYSILVARTVGAALAVGCGAGVPTARIILCAYKVVSQGVFTTRAARCDADVSTA